MSNSISPPWTTPVAGFRARKAAQICSFFALKNDGMIEKLKLIKLIYFAERLSLSKYSHPMLFDEFYSLPHGPICSSTLNGIDGLTNEELWSEYIARNGNILVAIKKLDRDEMDEISEAEMSVISDIWDKMGHMSPSQLRNYSHKNCPEYTETESSRIPISYKQVFEALGEEDAEALASEIDEMIRLDGMLADQ